MSSDALFQLGMAPAEPGTTQTEESSRLRPARARYTGFRRSAACRLLPACFRGNSAKALMPPA